MTLKFGKLPARPGSVKLRMMDYISPGQLPIPPENFGHDDLVKDWGMLANDKIGDCVIAGGAHETMLWGAMGGRKKPTEFSDSDVTDDYSAITGYHWWLPGSDQGTDMQEAAKFRQRTGLKDKNGCRHKIEAYVRVNKDRLDLQASAVYLFGAIGVGVACPSTMIEQFERGEPWTVVPGSKIEGYHYIPFVGRRDGFFRVITWGRIQRAHPTFFEEYCDEAIAYLTPEMMRNGLSAEGFDIVKLRDDLKRIQS